MNSLMRKIFVVSVLLAFSLPIFLHAAGVPSVLGYQGRLTDSNGNLLGLSSGTTYYFKFSIWNNSTVDTGNKLWPTSNPTSLPLSVRSGVFNVNIGGVGYPDPLNYDFNTAKDIYLQIEVSSNNIDFETLSPRQAISSVVFAQLSGAVSGIGQSSFGTTTPFGNSMVSVESTSDQSVGLSIRGFSSQLANLFQVQNSLGTNMFMIDKVGNVGVGTTTATRKFNVLDANSSPQLRLGQSGSVYGEIYVDPAGDVQVSSTGGNVRQNDENLWVCSGGGCGVDAPADKGNIIVENGVIFDNKFKLKQIDASTTIMYDTTNSPIFEFDEGQ